MDVRPIIFKRISSNDTVFFVFEVSNTKYVLYDSGMGDPIKYGSTNLIMGELDNQIKLAKERKRKRFKVYWMIRDGSKGWKENPQLPKGYSKDGTVNQIPKSESNTSHETIPKLKKISFTEEQFYWFDMGAKHVLYDADMGSPVSYGSRQFIYKTFNNIDKFVRDGRQKKYILWYFTRANSDNIWDHKQSPRVPNWKVEAKDKREATSEKKKEKEEDKRVDEM